MNRDNATTKEFSAACERNREPIVEVLAEIFGDARRVLEVGSGTGQHAVYFGGRLPHLEWQPSNQAGGLRSIRAWLAEAELENVREPIELDLFDESWADKLGSEQIFDAVVATNVIHIAPWEATDQLFRHAESLLEDGGLVYLYGPFRYAGRALEPSNERFDEWLRGRDARSGIRTFEEVDEVAVRHGFELVEDRAMPANNRSIWWRRVVS
jgi:SAM-dependent methyltransferase